MMYQIILDKATENIKRNISKSGKIAFVRLLFALIIMFLTFYIFNSSKAELSVVILCLLSAMLFLYSVFYHQEVLQKINYEKSVKNVCEGELAAIKGDIFQFDGGNEFVNSNHPFALDLDIFGENSIFQLINRTFTQMGKEKLANYLEYPLLEREKIINRQEAIKELTGKTEFRVDFLASGNLLCDNKTDIVQMINWLSAENNKYFSRFRILFWVIPIMNILNLTLVVSGIISISVYALSIIVQLFIITFNKKQINKDYLESCYIIPKFKNYVPVFRIVEKEKFTSILLEKFTPITQQLEELVRIGNAFSMGNSLIGGLILNTFFLWDYHCGYQFERWKQKHGKLLLNSIDILHEFESLVSVASYSFANSEHIFPQVVNDDKFAFCAIKLGHPLLKKENRVCNDFAIENSEQLFIITGSNMAGKSTFLRTVGVNLTLAMIGAPICANIFIFKPIQVFTCIRVTDSISDGKSYFHAELTRLSRIVKYLDSGIPLLVILDELLKGTNSKDKLLGSEVFLDKLLTYKNVYGLIATHDLDLTNMVITYPLSIQNICFEVMIDNNQMTFDYKIKEGITQNMNALFLMKELGII